MHFGSIPIQVNDASFVIFTVNVIEVRVDVVAVNVRDGVLGVGDFDLVGAYEHRCIVKNVKF